MKTRNSRILPFALAFAALVLRQALLAAGSRNVFDVELGLSVDKFSPRQRGRQLYDHECNEGGRTGAMLSPAD
jgi:hypothetical protein